MVAARGLHFSLANLRHMSHATLPLTHWEALSIAKKQLAKHAEEKKEGGGTEREEGGEARSRFRPQFCTNYIKLTSLLRHDCQLHACHWIFINRNCVSKEESGGERWICRVGESAGVGEGQKRRRRRRSTDREPTFTSLIVYSSELEYLKGWE